MKFAYADPPYLGLAEYYKAYHPDWKIWNSIDAHKELIDRLVADYPDGWALSLHEKSLRHILPLCPEGARVGAWLTKTPRLSGSKSVGVSKYFEPLIWTGGRKYGAHRTPDFVVAQNLSPKTGRIIGKIKREDIRDGRAFLGQKPIRFCKWVFDLLGADRGDEMHDLFPGSGAVSAAWAEHVGATPELPLTPLEEVAKLEDQNE